MLRVTNQGLSIPPEMQDSIFDPFVSATPSRRLPGTYEKWTRIGPVHRERNRDRA